MEIPVNGSATEDGNAPERRVYHNLRVIFDAACKITEPFFDVQQGWGGSHLTMYARQALRDAYPELTQQEIALLLSGVVRHHRGIPGSH